MKKLNIPSKIWINKLNHRNVVFNLSKKIQIQTPQQWYSIKIADIPKSDESYLIFQNFGFSFQKALIQLFPEYKDFTFAWKFCKLPNQYWNSIENQRYFMESVSKKLMITKMEDWYKISSTTVKKHTKSIYLKYNSAQDLLKQIYPNYLWFPWKFKQVSRGYWTSLKNQRFFFEHLSTKYNIVYLKDWYRAPALEEITNKDGFYQQYNSNVRLVACLFPDYRWLPWKFDKVPNGYWNSLQHQKFLLEELKKELNISLPEDWYKISAAQIRNYCGIYDNFYSIQKMLQSAYPFYCWVPWRFSQVPKGSWTGLNGSFNQRQFMEFTAKNLSIKFQTDWYNVRVLDIDKNVSILPLHKGTLALCLLNLCPEIEWFPWKFTKVSANFWNVDQNVENYLQWCESYFNIKEKSEWHKISNLQICDLGGTALLRIYNGLPNILFKFYPEESWDSKKLISNFSGKKNQFTAFKLVQKIFKKEKIELDYQVNDLYFEGTNKKIQYDIFIPSLNIGFGYLGLHHFDDSNIYGSSKNQKKLQLKKKKISKDNGITFIEIPYWWNLENTTDLYKKIITEKPELKLQK